MQIRFIVETVTRARDRNGNCYHTARIVSTRTGCSLQVLDTSRSNCRALVSHAVERTGTTWAHELYEVERNMPARDYDRFVKNIIGGRYEHQITDADILALEREPTVWYQKVQVSPLGPRSFTCACCGQRSTQGATLAPGVYADFWRDIDGPADRYVCTPCRDKSQGHITDKAKLL